MSKAENATPTMWKFDDFEPGVVIGRKQMSLTPSFFEQWVALYPRSNNSGSVPMGAVALILMQAYTSVIENRPPGNVHVGQRCTLHRLPHAEALMEASVKCLEKRLSGERRIIQLLIEVTDATRHDSLMSGLMTLFWAQ